MNQKSLGDRLSEWAPYLLSVLRFVTGFLFIQHGAQKLFGVLGKPAVAIASQAGVGGIIEFFGGMLMILGLLTRPAAFILSGTMAVAYFQFHGPKGFWTVENGGELAVLYCFVFLFFTAAGGGPWSLDRLIFKKK